MEKCWECGAKLKIIRGEPYHYAESGLDNIYLYGINQYECLECRTKGVSIPNLDALHRLIGRNLVRKEERFTGPEIRFLRKELHLKTKSLANILGVDPATISRWENNKKPISEICDKLMRNLYISYASEQTGEVFQKGILDLLSHVSKNIAKHKKRIEFSASDWLLSHSVPGLCEV